MNRHDAVVLLARVAAPLTLDAGRLVALLGMARLIQHADRARMAVIAGHDLSDAIPHAILVPLMHRQEVLETPRLNAHRIGDRLDALAMQVRQLPANVSSHMPRRLDPTKAIVELPKICRQLRFKSSNLFGIHALSPCCRMAST